MKVKTNKGITLIALVITIIVLLILAGVSVVSLTGENGILTKATWAKMQNDKTSIKEQIKLAVLTSRMNDNLNASIDISVLETELNKINGLSIESKGTDDKLPWTVTANKYKFQIIEDGKVEEINGILLSATTLKMIEGQEPVTITATLTEGVTGNISWSSDNENIATVNNGTITLVGTSGIAKITAKVDGTDYSAECTVTVVSRVRSISVSENTFQIETNEEKIIEVKTTPSENVEDLTYTYDVNNSNVAVDNNGKVKGLTAGTSTITITGTGISGTSVSTTCTVTVIKPAEPEVGDFVNYSAGNWEQSDLNKLGDLYAGEALPTSSTPYKFGGFKLGQSKDESITPVASFDNTYSGWRILSKNADGTYNIIHAGTTEGYYHPNATGSGYKSQYVLGGGKNSSGTSTWGDYETITKRDWSMYENTTYAQTGSARSVTYDDLKDFSLTNKLRRTGTFYWAPLAAESNKLYRFSATSVYDSGYNKCYGVRPVLSLKSNVKFKAKSGDTTHVSRATAWQLETVTNK